MVEQGFSSRDPFRARETLGGIIARRTGKAGRVLSVGGGGSGGGMSISRQVLAQQQKAAAEAARIAKVAAQQEAQRQKELLEAQERAKQEAQRQKQIELFAIREQRVQEHLREVRESGILINQQQAEQVIRTREKSEIKQAGITARTMVGPTGEVGLPSDKTELQKVKEIPSKIARASQKQIDVVDVTKKAVGGFREKVVVPLRIAIPSLGDTPIGQIAEAKRIIESKQPGETVRIGLPGQVRDVDVGRLKPVFGGGFFETSAKIAVGESGLALKDLAGTYQREVVVPISKSKTFKDVEKKVITPISEFGVQPIVGGVRTGFDFYKEEVVSPLRETFPSLGDTPIGQIAEAKRIIESKQPGETVRIGLPGQVRDVDVGRLKGEGLIGFGKEVFLGEVEQSFTDIARAADLDKGGKIRAETIGKGIRVGTELLSFTLPGFFVGEVAAKAAEAQIGGGAFGGPKSAFQFVVENPLEVGLAAAVGVGGIVRTAKARKLRKFQELIKAPEQKLTILEQRIAKETLKPSIVKPRIEFSSIDDVTKGVSIPKTKGRIFEQQFIPESRQVGKVLELRAIGKKPSKIFKGLAEVSGEGTLKETIKIGDITKVIEVTKEGRGTVTLFKKGKSIFTQELKRSSFPDLTFARPKISKLKVDKQFGGQGITETEIATRGGRISKFTDDVGDLIVGDIKPTLKSKLVTSKIETTNILGKDLSSGVSQTIERQRGFLDVIQVGPRKGIIKLSGTNGEIAIRKRAGQIIEFGLDDTIDISLVKKIGKESFSFKEITPRIQRDITEFAGQKTITRFVNPEVKSLKALQKLTTKAAKERAKKITVIDRAVARESFDIVVKDISKAKLDVAAVRRGKISQTVKDIITPKAQVAALELSPIPSEFAFGQRLGPQLASTTFVPPTETLLRLPISSPIQTPFITGAEVTIRTTPASIITGLSSSFVGADIKIDLDTKNIQKQDVAPDIISISRSVQFQQPVEDVIQRSISRQTSKQREVQKSVQKSVQKQIQKQTQIDRPITNIRQPPIRQPATPKIPEPTTFILPPLRFAPVSPIKSRAKSFGVSIRRGGVFGSVVTTKSLNKALSIGRQRVGGTLAATFKLTGPGVKPLKLPGFRTKTTDDGILFIEKRSRRIKKKRTGSKEEQELKAAKAKKKRKSKR